jgi:hypothetical protein
MDSPQVVRSEPYDVDQRLAELGLERQTFVTAAQENYASFAACTANHPSTYPGTAAWADMNRSLAESLIISDWGTKLNEMNLPLVINMARTMAITASSGDADTGIEDGFPTTRSAKGPRTADAVRVNKRQQKFSFMEDPAQIAAAIKVPGRATWIFLVYRDMRRGEIRSELSHPVSMSTDGHVNKWAERIIFPPIPFETNPSMLGDEQGTGGQSPEISVEIKKRG